MQPLLKEPINPSRTCPVAAAIGVATIRVLRANCSVLSSCTRHVLVGNVLHWTLLPPPTQLAHSKIRVAAVVDLFGRLFQFSD
ncbi:unnamed protein product [Nezara viridula]|uniref:Uncharacterized protein n=1 Tax=Nezara viridula TaxID=85310 RepID=A0A9P0HFZ9_NEZVI|nr:unnamed protein product [Nezara viridula]